jgi:hypothetical protein
VARGLLRRFFPAAFLALMGLLGPFSADCSAQVNPVPQINQPLVPGAAVPGGAGFTLKVNGTGFVSGSVVNWNGNARSTQFVSKTQVTATIPASDIAGAGTASVTIVNPAPGGGTSNVAFFEVTNPTSFLTMDLSNYAQCGTPRAIAIADFNGDGGRELAITNHPGYPIPDDVCILLENGAGTFRIHNAFATGSNPSALAVGDFNGDGKLDLAVANAGDRDVSILLNNGGAFFLTQVTYAVGGAPSSVVVGDFDGDGKLDLAVGASPNVYILLGRGDGTFQPAVAYPAGSGPNSLVVGDFNGDGKLDLAAAGGDVSILLGNGDGTFRPPVVYATPPHAAVSLTTGDFNGDGNLDLAVALRTCSVTPCPAGIVSVLLGNGDGTFRTPVDYATGGGPEQVIAADLNGDGKLDLATANLGAPTVSVLLGNGDGTFQTKLDFDVVVGPHSLAAGDLNGDGRLDLAVSSGVETVGHIRELAVGVLLQTLTPVIVESPTSLDFGDHTVGSTSPAQTIQVSNQGTAQLTLQGFAFMGSGSSDFSESDNCPASLIPGASCTISVKFTPSAPGTRIADLIFVGQGNQHQVQVTGRGIGPAASLSLDSLVFNSQLVSTTSRLQTVTLTSTGTVNLNVTAIAITGTDSGDFAQTNNCGPLPAALAPNIGCTISVTFTPTASGARAATLLITDDGGSGSQGVGLTGTGMQPLVTLSPASLAFNNQPVGKASAAQTFTLANSGTADLRISAIGIVGANSGDFSQTNTCGTLPAPLVPNSSCTFSLTFTPTAIGARAATLQITDNAGSGSQGVGLTGTDRKSVV